jgi:uncharacterized protein
MVERVRKRRSNVLETAGAFSQAESMLELRPACERCHCALPPDSPLAYICSYECTYCAGCVALLGGSCPNCGGEVTRRPRRALQAPQPVPTLGER